MLTVTARVAVQAGYELNENDIKDLIEWCTALFNRWRITEWIENMGGWVSNVVNLGLISKTGVAASGHNSCCFMVNSCMCLFAIGVEKLN